MNITKFFDFPQEIIRKIYSYNRISKNDARYRMLEKIFNNYVNQTRMNNVSDSGYLRIVIYLKTGLILIKHILPDMFIEYILYNLMKNTSIVMRYYLSQEFRLNYAKINDPKNAKPFGRDDLQILSYPREKSASI